MTMRGLMIPEGFWKGEMSWGAPPPDGDRLSFIISSRRYLAGEEPMTQTPPISPSDPPLRSDPLSLWERARVRVRSSARAPTVVPAPPTVVPA